MKTITEHITQLFEVLFLVLKSLLISHYSSYFIHIVNTQEREMKKFDDLFIIVCIKKYMLSNSV